MKEIRYTPEQIRDQKYSELMEDLLSTATVKEELWRYHPDNPNKKDVEKEYDILIQIEKDIELELAELNK
jgi:hypothetical protein|tara:strand:+ start:35 stop:244 length:210 start_codon:yes stop_codon:yes gene_type:complete